MGGIRWAGGMPVRSAMRVLQRLAEFFNGGQGLVMTVQALCGCKPKVVADQRDVDAVCFGPFIH